MKKMGFGALAVGPISGIHAGRMHIGRLEGAFGPRTPWIMDFFDSSHKRTIRTRNYGFELRTRF